MEQLMKISEFSALSGISRKLLIYYDSYGILRPRKTDAETGYRYYSYRQMDTASVIVSLRQAGMSLECIRDYLQDKSPERLLALLEEQEEKLKEQTGQLTRIQKMVRARKRQTKAGLAAKPGEIAVRHCKEENLFLGPMLPADFDALTGWRYTDQFCKACKEQGIQLGFPVSTMVEKEKLEAGNWERVSCFYCRLPGKGYPKFFTRPAGDYLVGTDYADYGCAGGIYKRLFSYVEEHSIKICGNAYEEYLLDEIAREDAKHYLLRISIQVESRGKSGRL